ncbi:type I DNA topoisomerase [Anaerotignum sp. MB30-C6]|uniref:type I DNA topoisomerase n=1 Tax=Anaerotignum sp. MB30-C6 TaxID=3070814 RepID=UPI0027DDA59A|nr:type I DNA topoisomerase [Anaerotignum sp. MB30-C6]WMI82690.1 type I DNA topoisomerase [Anaerotignum sp. MB30-C6]
MTEKKSKTTKTGAKGTKGKKYLVIVESPAKAATIGKFLGSSYKIEASMGHIRDLPKSQLGIDVENDFEPKYITIRGKGDLLSKLRRDAKNADKVFLATDPDREGEAISWHLLHALNLGEDKSISRITFNEITKNAVKRSISEARNIDMDLVDAQQARRVLDRMVGYTISDLLWQKVKKGLSGGRVQSVALRIICDREEEILAFIPTEYWSLTAKLSDKNGKHLDARFYGKGDEKLELPNGEITDEVIKGMEGHSFEVIDVKTGSRQKKPVAPFTTSTLQQEASKHLNMATQKTMMIAQQLYEGINIKGEGTVGLVSYIRTDSFRISDEAYDSVVAFIKEEYGEKYVNPERVVYKSKGKTQDAHEAIRPTEVLRTPDSIKESLSKDQFRLYKLIWERFVASQMSPALYDTLSVKLQVGEYAFRSSGSSLKFKGFLEAYNKGEEEDEKMIPLLEKGDILKTEELLPEQHFTQPPARFTDASLIKTLEEIGVGRPSTYAPTLTTIQARHYVTKEAKNLYPTELGEVVNDIMKSYFGDIVDVDFTANMEKRLDEVEVGNEEWKQVIRDFYPGFKECVDDAREKLAKVEIKDEESDIICEKCGRNMVIKYGRYGKFLACPGFPECQNAKPFFEEAGVNCPECGGKVLIKKTKKGRAYYGCENNPECGFMSWNKPTGEKCPVCASFLEEKGRKNPKIVCSNEKCSYVKEKPAEEEEK